jgi:NAD(P)-dependent dehydrogenase (short-subunit alcohol dehydrogenase family)
MDLQLADRVVIVIGAAAGIGRATAALLTAEGAVVEASTATLSSSGSATRAVLSERTSPTALAPRTSSKRS